MSSYNEQEMSIGAERAVELQNAERLMKEIMIPPRPTILIEVLNEQSRSDPDLHKIGRLISKDVAISAGVLRVVNSSFFGLPRKITSIDHAVRMIGVRSVTNIVTALMLHSAFSDMKGGVMDEFWSQSSRLAAATSFAARLSPEVSTEEAYSLGLFANCGVPLMLRKFPEYPSVYERAIAAPDMTFTAYEESELDTNHTLVGYIMGKKWDLPAGFCQCILRHHDLADYYVDPEIELDGITSYLAVLQLGHYFSRAYDELPTSYEWIQTGRHVCRFLDIDDDRLDALKTEALDIISEASGPVA
jgi:HD-like signal output (HDOD) protein